MVCIFLGKVQRNRIIYLPTLMLLAPPISCVFLCLCISSSTFHLFIHLCIHSNTHWQISTGAMWVWNISLPSVLRDFTIKPMTSRNSHMLAEKIKYFLSVVKYYFRSMPQSFNLILLHGKTKTKNINSTNKFKNWLLSKNAQWINKKDQ